VSTCERTRAPHFSQAIAALELKVLLDYLGRRTVAAQVNASTCSVEGSHTNAGGLRQVQRSCRSELQVSVRRPKRGANGD
jgi:hypothetical protein